MADFIANRALGRGTEWTERVNANDPTNSVIVLQPVAATGRETDAVLKDKDDFTSWVSGATDFATNTGSTRKVWDQAAGLTVTYDDTNDRVDVDIPDPVFTAVATSPGAWGDLLTGYDSDSTTGTDANILPWTNHAFAVTPDGSDITAVVAVGGFFRAQ